MDRRRFVQGCGTALGLSALSGRARSGEGPNVLLVMCDQLRRPMWWPEATRLPALERLAARGVWFDNHFVSAVPCSPSRACLMTGLHMDQNGVFNNMNARGGQQSLDPSIPNLGHIFQAAGYRTPYFGKWHLSTGELKKGGDGLVPYGFEPRARSASQRVSPLPGLRSDDDVTRAALGWLEHNGRSDPWFLTLSLINPHDICAYPGVRVPDGLVPNVFTELPPNFDDDLAGKPRCQAQYRDLFNPMGKKIDEGDRRGWLKAQDYYYFLCRVVDRQLGLVLDRLEALGLVEDTMVVFTSDHGEMGGAHQLRLKGPFVYRENVNVPLVVSWPGRLPEGKRTGALSQNVDLFPTLAATLGLDVAGLFPYLPGQDLTPALLDPEGDHGADHVLFSFTDNINLRQTAQAIGVPGVTAPSQIRALREKSAVFARYFDPDSGEEEHELYDLERDPLELTNLADDPAARPLAEKMAARLKQAEATAMAPVDWTPERK